ncbi:acyl-CoA carboxylase subunit epsilon [Nonomuraea sp. MG754425]|uniref:acyl-CoA carboxylase subunit epsilon n=1 Tax=Nonomuraea sp. MG754425 TaxID=2570319 RepID=UPI001F1BAC7F|nr:acyl-CoA carboxylase subunit epsilon [Nonomuraea sp. MG754425]MCF6468027.1 acyl-CoA carboxylase subunit epsilon [Nonomuraea sp. MG754425]
MTGHLRIVQGDATPEEIAALAAVLASRRAEPETPPQPPRRQTWRNPARAMRKPVVPGKSAWRMSALP